MPQQWIFPDLGLIISSGRSIAKNSKSDSITLNLKSIEPNSALYPKYPRAGERDMVRTWNVVMFLWDLKAGQQNKNEKVHSFRCLYLKPLVLFFFFSTFSAVFFNKISVSSVFLSTCTWSSTLECILTVVIILTMRILNWNCWGWKQFLYSLFTKVFYISNIYHLKAFHFLGADRN